MRTQRASLGLRGGDVADRIGRWIQPVAIGLITGSWLCLEGRLGPEALFFGVGIATLAILQMAELVLERHPEWRISRQELATDAFYTAIFYAIAVVVLPMTEVPLARLGSSARLTGLWPTSLPFLARGALALIVIELGQYWLHRLMHNSFLWRVHGPHHHLTQLNAWKGAVGQPIELWLVQLSVLPLLGAGLEETLFAGNIVSAVACFAHGNIAGLPPKWYAFVFTTISPHSLHHSVGYEETRCNYANALICIDRLFGTFREGAADPSRIGQGSRRRLSIVQQWAFPVRRPDNVETPLV
jgi:sterol desaturase/sphingolipid hydroxylase (fatty acid hydroxylase superfamily)